MDPAAEAQGNTTFPATTANLISWESALFALIPFAFNSMTQPAGPVCGAPAALSFFLRSSPIICVVDALLLLTRYLYYIHTSGRTLAQTRLLLFRFQTVPGDKPMEGSLANRGGYPLSRIVIFLVTLSQIVKLYAYSGLVRTKIVASMYFISFIIVEALVTFPQALNPAQPAGNTPKRVREAGPTSISYIAIGATNVLTVWFATSAFQNIFDKTSCYSQSQWIGIVMLVYNGICSLVSLLYTAPKQDSKLDIALIVILWLIITGLPCAYFFSGHALEMLNFSGPVSSGVSVLFIILWASLGLIFMSSTTSPIRHEGGIKLKRLNDFGGWYFLVINLVTAFLYYRFSYSSDGTSKPAWTAYLG